MQFLLDFTSISKQDCFEIAFGGIEDFEKNYTPDRVQKGLFS